jgi:uncharacterized protein
MPFQVKNSGQKNSGARNNLIYRQKKPILLFCHNKKGIGGFFVMRYLKDNIIKDLNRNKMVFLSGPRQCGKTTLAEHILHENINGGIYLNWDDIEHKQKIQKRQWDKFQGLIVLDEIHKMDGWKNFLKGTYDTQKSVHKFFITGSARLDTFTKSGDSLLGRYHLWRLHPFTLQELAANHGKEHANEILSKLLAIGGFPEPYYVGEDSFARRWRRERYERILREDIFDLSGGINIQKMLLLVSLLRKRVGSEVVFANISQDIQISPKTVKSWIEYLVLGFVVFQVFPYSENLPRALQKAPKAYFFDSSDVDGNEGAKLENQVACELLRKCDFLTDSTGYLYQIYYIRDREKREVDFLVTKDSTPIILIEVKVSEQNPSPSLNYFGNKLNIKEKYQLSLDCERKKDIGGVICMTVSDYFTTETSW